MKLQVETSFNLSSE